MTEVFGDTKRTAVLSTRIEQLSFAPNGNLSPCPYRLECRTYGIGCQGVSYWCKNGEEMRIDNRKLRVRRSAKHI